MPLPGSTQSQAATTGGTLGTFLGVYTPSILTILGVILFLRAGWLVGNVGLVPALSIVLLAHAITVATSLSVSAVATNMHVGAGGAYYIISRTLGLEIGGAIGIPLFLAQTFSVTLYAFGLAESLQLLWPGVPLRTAAAITVVAVSLIASRGAEWALRLQIPILIAIALSLGSLVLGATSRARDTVALWQGVPDAVPFWVAFAVFFPAVTGIMAGISLSGDLADPTRSIPRGTLLAVLTGLAVYLAVPVVLAAVAEPEVLVADNLVWFKVAAIPLLIYPGLWGAIFSSAVGSILGAPRTLEALARDRVIPGLGRVPERFGGLLGLAHVLSTLVALAAVALGDLNAVAPVLTMFFLTTYGMVNLVAGLEQLSGAPSYRPTIQVPWALSLAGAVGCFWVMWLISPIAMLVAVALEIAIYTALRRRALQAAWGDMRYGALMSLTRVATLGLRRLPVDPRNWRPHILVFAGEIEERFDLVRFGAWLNQDRGILTVCRLLVGRLDDHAASIPAEVAKIDHFLDLEGLTAFPEVDVVSDFEGGALDVAQANGIAGITSNTLMFGWSDRPEPMVAMLRIMRQASLLGKSTVVCRLAPRSWSTRFRRIDVWWGGLQHNGDMLLLFAHLLSMNSEWSRAKIAVKSIASNAMTTEQTERSLRALITRSRIPAKAEVINRDEGTSIQDVIHESSRGADIVFMGLQEPRPGQELAYAERLSNLVGNLPTVILVRAAGPFAGQLI